MDCEAMTWIGKSFGMLAMLLGMAAVIWALNR
jgi:hypothetical protein